MKKRAHFIKIYIKDENHKLNFPPIPFFMTTTIISIVKFILSIVQKSNPDTDVFQILKDCQFIIKELKNYPPIELVNVESENTSVVIKTL